MKKPWPIVLLALLLYTPLFIFRSLGPLDFWWWMLITVFVVMAGILWADKAWSQSVFKNMHRRKMAMTASGILSALILYAVFFAGNWLSRAILPFAGSNIQHVYHLKDSASLWRIGLLIALIIGPAEELIWRAYVQEKWMASQTPLKACLMTTFFYTAIHFGSGNLMLILAAMVCGLFWGGLYMRHRSVWLNVLSHTLWDVMVFLIFPFQ